MNKNPITLVDDDNEDLEMIQQAFAELNIENEIIIFNDGLKFLDFLRETQTRRSSCFATLTCLSSMALN